jgi:hypothetical protein
MVPAGKLYVRVRLNLVVYPDQVAFSGAVDMPRNLA